MLVVYLSEYHTVEVQESGNVIMERKDEERANVVKKALTDAGIAAGRIVTEFYGATQQVSGVPEQNRVAVCVTK